MCVPTRGVVSADGDLSAGTNMLAAARCGRANRPRRGSGQNTDRAAVSSVPPRVKSPAGLWLDDAWRSQVESGLRAHGRDVGEFSAHRFDSDQLLVTDQPVEQLGVVQHRVVAAQLWVLAADRVEAVRAGDDDLAVDGLSASNSSLMVSTFCCASCWNRNSLPARRAESLVQVSPVPSTRYFTPVIARSWRGPSSSSWRGPRRRDPWERSP